MYLRELHEQRLLLEKENNLKEGNRREAHSECRPDKDRKEMGKPIYEAERVKVEMTSHPNENRDNNMTRIAFDHKKEDVPGRLKPGIYLYRKKINLAEPA